MNNIYESIQILKAVPGFKKLFNSLKQYKDQNIIATQDAAKITEEQLENILKILN